MRLTDTLTPRGDIRATVTVSFSRPCRPNARLAAASSGMEKRTTPAGTERRASCPTRASPRRRALISSVRVANTSTVIRPRAPAGETLTEPWSTSPRWRPAIVIALAVGPESGERPAPGGPPGAVVVLGVVVVGVVVPGVDVDEGPVDVGPVVVVVVVVGPSTTIVAIMNGCRSQWKVYVPGVLNVQVPLHPGAVG